MNTEYMQLPVITCPHCGTEQQWDDYWDLHSGSSRWCQKCKKEIYILSVDTVMYARISGEKKP